SVTRLSGAALQSDRAPKLFPVMAVLIGDAAVLGEELVRDLEHRDHDAAFGRRRRVAAAGLAPYELAGTDGQALGRAFLVDQLAGDDVCLLDHDVLMVGQNR